MEKINEDEFAALIIHMKPIRYQEKVESMLWWCLEYSQIRSRNWWN